MNIPGFLEFLKEESAPVPRPDFSRFDVSDMKLIGLANSRIIREYWKLSEMEVLRC
jgi:hypothetical protein